MLHLIKVHEIDIFSIDILKLATEYLNYLRCVRYEDLAGAGEFVAMAATLVEIKSRMLLPRDENAPILDDLEEEDPIKQLQERLAQYEQIKAAAVQLAARPQLGVEIQLAHEHVRLADVFKHIETPLEGDPVRVIIMYDQLLRDLAERKHHRVEAKTHLITLEQTIEKLSGYIETVRFGMFQGFYSRFVSRYDMVVYFMAALELAKTGRIRLYQQDFLGPLWLYHSSCDVSQLPIGTVAVPTYVTEGIHAD